MKRYGESVKRDGSLIGFQAWNVGDLEELRKWIGWGFERHYFVNEGGLITLFYDKENYDRFEDILAERLADKEFFNRLVRDFIEQVNLGRELIKKELGKQEVIALYKIMVKCWPGTTIFDEISNYVEMVGGDEEIINRILELRRDHGEFLYEVEPIISEAISLLYPELEGFEEVILIQEISRESFPTQQELEKRRKNYILYEHFLETDKSFSELVQEHELEVVWKGLNLDNEVRGDVAMRGKARGKVKIILKYEDIYDVDPGDILVASMTTPDHITAMEKADAFVTDEGGIACHAAIIAREFRKPCIVGTGNATKVFKNNDLVFVDADEGIVKKI